MATGDIVVDITADKRNFASGVESVSADLRKVRKEISLIAPAAAAGNKEAFLSLVSLVSVEEHLAGVARKSAETEAQARRLVVGQVKEQIVQEQRLDSVLQRRTITFGARGRGGRGGGGGALAGGGIGGGLGTGIAYGLSDAVTAAQFGGGRAAALSVANNLPQIGQGLTNVGLAARAAGGPIGTIGGFLAKWAGPTGLILSVAVPLAAAFAPALLETESAADKAEKSLKNLDARLEKIRKQQADSGTLEKLTSHNDDAEKSTQVKTLDEQRKKVSDLTSEYNNLKTVLLDLAHQQTLLEQLISKAPLGFGAGDDKSRLEDVRRQFKEAESRLKETRTNLTAEEHSLARGEATRRKVTGEGREYITEGSSLAQDQEYRKRLRNEREGEQNAARMEQQRIANIAAESMQRSLVSGLTSRLGGLQRQREGLLQSPRSFNLPSIATRGNSIDKQIEMGQAKREAMAESQRKMQIEKLDKMIELTEKLLDEAKNSPTLKPAGVG